MKRSEMQRLLAGLLSTMYETDRHPEEQLSNAENVLSTLERYGMKAPLVKKCPVLLTNTYTWENEND